MVNNCSSCKFKESAFSDLSKISEGMVHLWGTFHVKCLAGNNDKIADFYTKNKEVPTSDIVDELDCFTKTKISEDTDKLIGMMDNLLQTIEKV